MQKHDSIGREILIEICNVGSNCIFSYIFIVQIAYTVCTFKDFEDNYFCHDATLMLQIPVNVFNNLLQTILFYSYHILTGEGVFPGYSKTKVFLVTQLKGM